MKSYLALLFNWINVMSPSDVPAWLKSLRLHKYAGLFSTMTYDEMMSLTEQQLEAQVGAFIALIVTLQEKCSF